VILTHSKTIKIVSHVLCMCVCVLCMCVCCVCVCVCLCVCVCVQFILTVSWLGNIGWYQLSITWGFLNSYSTTD